MTNRKLNTSTSEEATAPFALKLPSRFDIKPIETLAISQNYTAKVYKVERKVRDYNDDGKTVTKRETQYSIRVVHNKTGAEHSSLRAHGTYDSEFDVFIRLEAIAAYLQPKKKTTVVEEDND